MSDIITLPNDGDADDLGFGVDPIVREAHRRFERCQKWEAIARQRGLDDNKFAHGDSENNYQWPDRIYSDRVTNDQPALTINKTRQHNLQIINDAKQKKSGIKYRPIGDGATAQAAETLEGIVRHIQDVSNANMHRGTAIEYQVNSGLGVTRIVTRYEHDRTFDQEIYIAGVTDPNSVYVDCDSIEPDWSDARYGFVFADRPRDEVETQYPWLKYRLRAANAVEGGSMQSWLGRDTVRECEYYWIEEKKDELIGNLDGEVVLRSLINAQLLRAWEDQAEDEGESLKTREVVTKKLRWALIIGDQVVEERDPPGKSIPLVPYIGEQTIIDNQLDRKGHTRALKDAQRMLNYNRSAQVQYGALQGKMPWIGPARAIEGYETYWETANVENHALLPYNDVDENGQPIAPPNRIDPPATAPAFTEGAQAAERDMMVSSGQYEAMMGAQGNEITGRAINERQRQGDRATYHFIDNQAIAIRREGEIILELIPEVYDTMRAKRVLGEDGSESSIIVDPGCDTACQATADSMIFNPKIGIYAVVADVGPDYATQRQEAFAAIVSIIKEAPEVLAKCGDLLFTVADFPLADKMAERLKPGMAPEAQAEINELKGQTNNLTRLLGEAMQSLTEERLKVQAKDSSAVIDAFEADTKRLAVVKEMLPLFQEQMSAIVVETVRQALQDNLGPVRGAAAPNLATAAAGGDLPGATGAIPAPRPDVGQQAATPGGL